MKNSLLLLLSILISSTLISQVPELKINSGHADIVTSVCYSPDDRYIASGSEDKTIKLWDVETGKELKTFTDTDKIFSVAFTSDGKFIISGGRAGAKLWEIQSGKATKISVNETQFAELTSDSKYVITASNNEGKIAINPIQPGEKKRYLIGHIGYLFCAKLSPDSKYLASGGSDKTIKLWNIETGTLIKTLKGHKAGLNSINFSPDGKLIVSGGGVGDGTVKIWNVATGALIKSLPGHSNAVLSVCFSPDGKYVVSASYDGTTMFWNVSTGENFKTYPENFLESIYSLNFSSDGRYLVTGNSKKTIRVIDLTTDKNIALLPGEKPVLDKAFFYPDGKSAINTNKDLTISEDGRTNLSVKLWNWNGSEKLKNLEVLESLQRKVNDASGSIEIIDFSGDHKNVIFIYSIGGKGTIAIYDIKSGECLKTIAIQENTYGIEKVALSDDSKSIAIGSSDRTIKVWNIENGLQLKASFLSFKSSLESMKFSPDGKFIVAGGEDDYPLVPVKVWSAIDGKKIMALNGHTNAINSVSFSPDGKYIASGSCDGNIKIWSTATKKEVKNIGGGKSMISSVNFSPDGKYLVSGHYYEEFTVKLWDFSTGQQIKTFTGHAGEIKSVQFSPDGKYIVSSSDDGSIKIWDTTSGECKVTRFDVSNSSDWIAVTPDGRFDGTDGGMKLLYYVKNLEIIPLESFYEKFYTPGLVAQVMSGNLEINHNLYAAGKDITLPPKVKILSPTTTEKFPTDQIEVLIEATDQGGGVDEIRLYQNGKLVIEEQRGMKSISTVGEKVTKKYQISLLSGNNELKATAFNSDRTEAIPHTINIELSSAIKNSNLYLVSIGINKYKNEKYTLSYSGSDAEGFTQAIASKSKGIFKEIKTLIIKDEECTKTTILSRLDELSKIIKPEDVLIFYYAGHGVMSEGSVDKPSEFFFIPYDVTQLYGNDELLQAKGISASELRKALVNIKAQKQLIVMDACQSGGATEMLAMRGAAEEKALMQLARSAGIAVLSSTGTEQFASELKELGHGVFTYSLIDGLSGKADGGEKDGKITIKELAAFLEDNVPELTKKFRGTAQYPNTSIRGMDFPVVVWK